MFIGQPELQKGHSMLEAALAVVLVVAVPGLLLYFLHLKQPNKLNDRCAYQCLFLATVVPTVKCVIG